MIERNITEELEELQRLLGWVNARTRAGCFSHKRSERDAALADVNAATQAYEQYWTSSKNPTGNGRVWFGEKP
jgi:hypothetical protein